MDHSDQHSSGYDDDLHNQQSSSGNLSWSDAIDKVLKSGKDKAVLSRAKKEKKQGIDEEETSKEKRMKIDWETKARLKPDASDREKERVLTSIATKGVVQLFNSCLNMKSETKR